jgi:hypothetical protein
MTHPTIRRSPTGTQEWLSALFTLMVLVGIYNSMDHFSGFAEEDNVSAQSEAPSPMTV